MKLTQEKRTILETNKLLCKIGAVFLLSKEYIVNTTTNSELDDETHFRGIFLTHAEESELDLRFAHNKGLVSIYDLHLKYQV